MAREPKTRNLYVVQGHYGHGWEDLTASYDRAEAKTDLRAYRANSTDTVRLITRREKI